VHNTILELDNADLAHLLVRQNDFGFVHEVVVSVLYLLKVLQGDVDLTKEHLVFWEMLSWTTCPDEHHQATLTCEFRCIVRCVEAWETLLIPGDLDLWCVCDGDQRLL